MVFSKVVLKIQLGLSQLMNSVYTAVISDIRIPSPPNKDIHSYTSRCYTIIQYEQLREHKTIQNPLVPIPNLDLCVQSCPDAIDEVFNSKLHIIGGVGIGIGVIMVNTL